ncbi:MAG: ribosome maturation factor RimP [Clostridium sp.]
MNNNALIEKIETLVKPIADELNYEVYHIEFVKENNEFYLRIYIDKEEGISITDCEALSRRVSDVLDVEDPIDKAYYLEVSSPGLNRRLFTDEHFKKFVGREVLVKLNGNIEGKKNIKGLLKEVSEENIIVEDDEKAITIPKSKIKAANLEGEI